MVPYTQMQCVCNVLSPCLVMLGIMKQAQDHVTQPQHDLQQEVQQEVSQNSLARKFAAKHICGALHE